MANGESSAFGALKESWLLLSPFWRVLTVLFFILMFWIGPVLRDGISSGMDYAGKSMRSWWEKPAPSMLEEAARDGNIAYTADRDDRIAELMRKNNECIKSMSGEYRSTRAFKLGNQPYTIAFLVCNSGDIYYEISPRPDFSSSAIDFIDFRTLQAPLERQHASGAPATAAASTPAAATPAA